MYHETLNSLHMVNPITHLGHIRRSNISIEVSQAEKKTRNEYESDKFDFLISEIHKALIRGQKVLIYRNRLLELVNKRHKDSVDMLTYLFQSNFTSEEIWDHLENYFLGIMPDSFDEKTVVDTSIDCDDRTVILQIGDDFKEDYTSWSEAAILFDDFETEKLDLAEIPLADYYSAKLYAGIQYVDVLLAWQNQKVALVDSNVPDELSEIFRGNGWLVYQCDALDLDEMKHRFEE